MSCVEKCQVIGKNMKAPADSDVWEVKDEKFWNILKYWKPTFKWVIYGWLHELKTFACILFLHYIQQPNKTFQAEFTTQLKITTHVSLPSKWTLLRKMSEGIKNPFFLVLGNIYWFNLWGDRLKLEQNFASFTFFFSFAQSILPLSELTGIIRFRSDFS